MKARKRGTRPPPETVREVPDPRPRLAGALAAWGPLALVLSAAACLYAPAVRLPFFADDFLFLDAVRRGSLFRLLWSGDPIGNFWRPVGRQLHFWWVAAIAGETPGAFHLVNVLYLLVVLAALFLLVRQLLGSRAATIAAAFLALHYAVAVPVEWVAGCQDLLAVAGAIVALWCYVALRLPVLAALALLIGLLSKETVLLTPLVAVAIDLRAGMPWKSSQRRSLPLWLVTLVWAVLYAAHSSGNVALATRPSLVAIAATLVHLPQVLLGLEGVGKAGRTFALSPLWVAAVSLGLAAVGWSWHLTSRPASARPNRHREDAEPPTGRVSPARAVSIGLIWAVAGIVPIAAVVPIWSAYYYLFALCGAALVLGALLERLPLMGAAAALLVLAVGSQYGRLLQTFAVTSDPWSTESHVNSYYLRRSMSYVERFTARLKELHPTVPSNTTFYFAGVPSFVSWQVGDGPLVRWVYRDTTLRSNFLTAFTGAARGPVLFFDTEGDGSRLVEKTNQPQLYLSMALGMLLLNRFSEAAAIAELEAARAPSDRGAAYALALLEIHAGRRDEARKLAERAGMVFATGPSPEVGSAMERFAARDSSGAWGLAQQAVARHFLDPEAHALVAEYIMASRPPEEWNVLEAVAPCLLDSTDARAWRRWALVQAARDRVTPALASLDRYFLLAGAAASGDVQASQLRDWLRQEQPGGAASVRELQQMITGESTKQAR